MLAWAEFDDDRVEILEDTRRLMAGLCTAADERGKQPICQRFLLAMDDV